MSDNIYFKSNCPAKMSDGRLITDYHHREVTEDFYKSVLQARNEHDYRRKLQSNGENIIQGTLYYQMKKNTCDCGSKPCEINL